MIIALVFYEFAARRRNPKLSLQTACDQKAQQARLFDTFPMVLLKRSMTAKIPPFRFA